jgi:sugar phosphate isomerase/epimerase
MMDKPFFSVGEATTPRQSFADDLATYKEGGADGIGIIDAPKLHDTPDALARFHDSGLKAGFCIPSTASILPRPRLRGLYAGSDDPEARIQEVMEGMRRLAPFEPQFCICVPGPLDDYEDEPARAREIVVDGYRTIARAAADVGVTVGFEPLHSSMDMFTFVHTIPDAISFIDEIDEPNVGLVVDFWNLWGTPDLLTHIRANVERVVGVHVNDRRDPTRHWCDRVLPGDGIIDIPAIVDTLIDSGYDRWYELEVMSDDGSVATRYEDSVWLRDPVEVVRTARERFEAIWTASAERAAT